MSTKRRRNWGKVLQKKIRSWLGPAVILAVLLIGAYFLNKEGGREFQVGDSYINLSGIPKIDVGLSDIVGARGYDHNDVFRYYTINLVTKELVPDIRDKVVEIKELGVDEADVRDESMRVFKNIIEITPSLDGQKALVIVGIFDRKLSKQDDFFGSHPVSTQEFLCDVVDQSCQPSTILTDAHTHLKKAGGIVLENEDLFQFDFWHDWNPVSGLLFGYITGEGGPRFPVIIYDTNKKTFQQIGELDFKPTFGLSGYVLNDAMDKIAVRRHFYTAAQSQEIWLYNVHDTSQPYAILKDIRLRGSMFWSKNDKEIILNDGVTIRSVNISTKSVRELINITNILPQLDSIANTPNPGFSNDYYHLSPSGRYVYFTQFEKNADGTFKQEGDALADHPAALDLHTGELILYEGNFHFSR